jgi:hypothetical protein
MDGNHLSEDNPTKQTGEDLLRREMNNNYHVLFQIEQSLQDIRNAVEANTANIDILEEAIATLTPIPARKISLRYEHKENKLWVNDRYYIPFEGKEAYLLGLLFFPSSGKPRKDKVTFDDLVDDKKFYDYATNTKPSKSSFAQAAKRIESKFIEQLHGKNILTVTTKDMYFS